MTICVNCKHFRRSFECGATRRESTDYVTGATAYDYTLCEAKNQVGNCKDYEAKGGRVSSGD